MRIALLRLRLIGDVVFTTPVVAALRRRYPDAHLSYIVEPAAAPVLAGNRAIDTLMVAPRRRGVARVLDDIRLGARLRRERFDIAIDLHGGPRSRWLTWMSGAPMRIGYDIRGARWMYTHVVGRTDDLAPRHSVLNQWDLLAPLGIADPSPDADPVYMAEDTPAATAVTARLRAAGCAAGDPLIVIHVSAGNQFRRWPEPAFVDLVVTLGDADVRRRIVLTSGPSDREAAARVAAAARDRLTNRAQVLPIEDWSLTELRALTVQASVYIGGDSGPAHIAATTTTPIVELLGPTLPERSRPWRDARWYAETVDAGPLPCRPCNQRTCLPGDFRCLTGIAPSQVAQAAERAIAAARAPRDVAVLDARELHA